ncbi:hypothetical protein GLOTRDRAFT_119653 [Gloeophyllum trabeum ATCC 11539]|uniref:Uncharacterized protein n=1 Tax=Gloeophyllum trabeum (strain ATCC 11539 / FP-39264 / Madison 617) TaxID=670483 RepID=S7QK58_GLOTA|nr:uncharacterized protein GLOTRDRAFT_119653 [Gloeophyllum trabeum ATCC 11539]EPQ59628.1 hypothetical protein GLOTRDRAFT_119653 [Gloeophyllum trabeum ATCC 11539]
MQTSIRMAINTPTQIQVGENLLFIPDLSNPLHGRVKVHPSSPRGNTKKTPLFLPHDDPDIAQQIVNQDQLGAGWHTKASPASMQWMPVKAGDGPTAPISSALTKVHAEGRRAAAPIATFHAEVSSYCADHPSTRRSSLAGDFASNAACRRFDRGTLRRKVAVSGILNFRHLLPTYNLQDWGKERIGRLIAADPGTENSSGNVQFLKNEPCELALVAERKHPRIASADMDARSEPTQPENGAGADPRYAIPLRAQAHDGSTEAGQTPNFPPSQEKQIQKDHPAPSELSARSARGKSKLEAAGGKGPPGERSRVAATAGVSRRHDKAAAPRILTAATLNCDTAPSKMLGKRPRAEDDDGERPAKVAHTERQLEGSPEWSSITVACKNEILRVLRGDAIIGNPKELRDLIKALDEVERVKYELDLPSLRQARIGKYLKSLMNNTTIIPDHFSGVRVKARKLFDFFRARLACAGGDIPQRGNQNQ